MRIEFSPEGEKSQEILDDNDRKFISGPLGNTSLRDYGAVSYAMRTDWLEIEGDREKKLVYKQFADGSVQLLSIEKVTKENGDRDSIKTPIEEEAQYQDKIQTSIKSSHKIRAEFSYQQQKIEFKVKYDEFADSELRILEVDAADEATRQLFDPALFPTTLEEVTGDTRYYGHRVTDMV